MAEKSQDSRTMGRRRFLWGAAATTATVVGFGAGAATAEVVLPTKYTERDLAAAEKETREAVAWEAAAAAKRAGEIAGWLSILGDQPVGVDVLMGAVTVDNEGHPDAEAEIGHWRGAPRRQIALGTFNGNLWIASRTASLSSGTPPNAHHHVVLTPFPATNVVFEEGYGPQNPTREADAQLQTDAEGTTRIILTDRETGRPFDEI